MGQSDKRSDLQEVTYTPRAYSGSSLGTLRAAVRDVLDSRTLTLELMRREISSRYRQSFLGYFSAFFPPIVTAMWCTWIARARILNVEAVHIPYPVFVLVSMMVWMTFVEAMMSQINGLFNERSILSRAKVGTEAIVLSRIGVVLFDFCVKVVLIAAAAIWYGLPVSTTMLLVPLGVLSVVTLGTGIGLFLAPLNLLYRDISTAILPITTLWFFMTPVIFKPPLTGGFFAALVRYNPVTPLLDATRNWATSTAHPITDGFVIVAVISVVLASFGWIFMRTALPIVLERATN